jgi:Zn-dependent protease with chaperone function
MNFFEQQDRARRNTGRLVILFILAVIAIMAMVYFAVAIFVTSQGGDGELLANPMLILGVAGGTLLVVGGASLYKIAELSGGGETVALALGGARLEPGTGDVNDRKILNVVEEMAIASGTPVPPVFVMERERGINAFAAGYSPKDAVIGVSRGSVDLLTRDELQGVVAHEFSHIFNGDMRLNIRLIGILHGILVIGLIGHMIMRTAFYSGGSYRRSSRGKEGGGAAAIMLLGLALMIIGFVGTFFGKWIKSAVSRQREYLADASAVQFTRNPEGIAGALKKIGGLSEGSRLNHPRAEEMSHMFFGQALSQSFLGMFNTHPPLSDRIKRIDASWDGTYPNVVTPAQETLREEVARRLSEARQGRTVRGIARTPEGLVLTGGALASAVESIGRPTQAHVEYAREVVDAIPEVLRAAAREPYSARAVVATLLLSASEEVRRAQYTLFADRDRGDLFALVRKLEASLVLVEDRMRLPLVEMCMPALREMAREQYQAFRTLIDGLIEADQSVEIFEWALRRIVHDHLDVHFGLSKPVRAQLRGDPEQLQRALIMLLSNLAYAGHRDREGVASAFAAGARVVELSGDHLLDFEQVNLRGLDEAVDLLASAPPALKRRILAASAASIEADRQVTAREADLLRAIAEVFDAPMPPVLETDPV